MKQRIQARAVGFMVPAPEQLKINQHIFLDIHILIVSAPYDGAVAEIGDPESPQPNVNRRPSQTNIKGMPISEIQDIAGGNHCYVLQLQNHAVICLWKQRKIDGSDKHPKVVKLTTNAKSRKPSAACGNLDIDKEGQ